MNIKRLVTIILALSMLATLALSLTGCDNESRGTRGNMYDWRVEDLEPGDVYAEIRIRGHEDVMRFILFEEIAPEAVKAFIEIAQSNYYLNRTFHRVLEDILIQGGAFNIDGSDISAQDEDLFGIETHDNARNFYGALAFAVDFHTGKNHKQFYVVTANKPVNIDTRLERLSESIQALEEIEEPAEEQAGELAQLKEYHSRLTDIPAAARERYEKVGGHFTLDGYVTVFGQMIDGWELLREIAAVPVVAGNIADDFNNAIAPPGMQGRPSRPAEPVVIESVTIIRIPEADATQ
ncbi:MAG: peptidylprolyl isomerase [Oscillospiraceae bacterium]|nr:peptidylprolyl isomerase [Oscillospiraceae bacterium]